MGYTFDEATWTECYDDKFPCVDNNAEFNEATGEYQFIKNKQRHGIN